jgi:hypothetical protein
MQMRKLSALVAAVAAVLLAALPTTTTALAATRHSVLTIGKVGGPNVRVGAILQGSLKKGTKATFLVSGTKGVTCKSVSFKDKVVKNPTRPGTAVESLIAQTFKRCTVSPGLGATGVKSVVLVKLPYKTTISDSRGNPVTVFGTKATLSLNTSVGTISCTYIAIKNMTKGSASNKGQVISFSKQPFKRLSGPPNACPGKGSFSAAFAPVKDTSVKGSPPVFVN